MWPPMCAHWRHLVNIIELVLPSAHPSPQPKQQIDQLSQFCIANGRIGTLYKWPTLSPKLAPSHGGSGPHLTHDSLGYSELTIQTASQLVQLLSHRSPQSVPILYNGMTLSPQNCLFPWGDLDLHITHGSLGPPESSIQMASWSVQPFLQGSLVWQIDRQSDQATQSVTIHRIYVRSMGNVV